MTTQKPPRRDDAALLAVTRDVTAYSKTLMDACRQDSHDRKFVEDAGYILNLMADDNLHNVTFIAVQPDAVKAMTYAAIADTLLPATSRFNPGLEQPVMEIVDTLARCNVNEVRLYVAENFRPVYKYLAGQKGILGVANLLQADQNPDVAKLAAEACRELDLPAPQRPMAPETQANTPVVK